MRTVLALRVKQIREQLKTARDLGQNSNSLQMHEKGAAAEVRQSKTGSEQVNKTNPVSDRIRPNIQMMSNLYSDQIEWLTQIMNRGYDYSKTLVTRDEILKSLLDACREFLDGKIPEEFQVKLN